MYYSKKKYIFKQFFEILETIDFVSHYMLMTIIFQHKSQKTHLIFSTTGTHKYPRINYFYSRDLHHMSINNIPHNLFAIMESSYLSSSKRKCNIDIKHADDSADVS